jgi:site-specific recombinase XerD
MNYWTWHNLRHKYASELCRKGVPLFEIMNLLGHSNLKTTQNYLQLLGF